MYRLIRATAILALAACIVSACGSSREVSPSAAAPEQPVIEDPSVVAVVGTEHITLEEFEREYAKSAGGRANAAGDSLRAYEDFLTRYVNFRMKVAEARDLGLASDSDLLAEAASYRNSIARPFMIEQEILAPIIQELFERTQEVISTSHILIRVAPNAAPADTLSAYEKASALLDSLASGTDFTELARNYSEDPSAQSDSGPGSGGFLGFLPAGTLVPEFEDMAYNTAVGEVSPVFRTQFGYHILRVNGREPAVPDIRVAHLMVVPGAPDIPDPEAFLDSLKTRIVAGEDFATLARRYSMHQESAQRGGDLGFHLSRYVENGSPPTFKEAAFRIENVGDVSDVVRTPFGFHLIQLLERRDINNYAAMEEQLNQMASRSPRAFEAQRNYLEGIHTRYSLAVDSSFVFNALAGFDVDTLATILRTQSLPSEVLQHPVLTLGDSTYALADFAAFAARINRPMRETAREQLIELLNVYISDVTVNYAAETLEQRNEDFKAIMEDFRDGLLLFRIMEDSVWNAASADSAALLAHYQAHVGTYRYPERTRTIIFHAAETGLLQRVGNELDAGHSVTEIQAAFMESSGQLRIDTTFVSRATNSVYDHVLSLGEGAHSEPLRAADGYVILLRDGQEPARPKTFREARAEVISEYQEVLEQNLLNRLQRKYHIQMYPQRLVNAFEQNRSSPTNSLTAK